MKTFKIRVKDTAEYEIDYVETESEAIDKAIEMFGERIPTTEVTELCPHCNVELENKIHDTDGTNLIESMTCPDCGYGTPALN